MFTIDISNWGIGLILDELKLRKFAINYAESMECIDFYPKSYPVEALALSAYNSDNAYMVGRVIDDAPEVIGVWGYSERGGFIYPWYIQNSMADVNPVFKLRKIKKIFTELSRKGTLKNYMWANNYNGLKLLAYLGCVIGLGPKINDNQYFEFTYEGDICA